MRIASLFVLSAVAIANECSDFCKAKLDKEACSFGSKCTGKKICHGLYWYDETKTSICSRSNPDCNRTIKVTCDEAKGSDTTTTTESTPVTKKSSSKLRKTTQVQHQYAMFCFEGKAPPPNGPCGGCTHGCTEH
jgi:hypothetical protein